MFGRLSWTTVCPKALILGGGAVTFCLRKFQGEDSAVIGPDDPDQDDEHDEHDELDQADEVW